mmetsp:Transcript_17789/g.35144  ORF Transcript_17789/g.35144 Transcript_17789/m.35144 type:complete len:245 (-) Transcript_17789:890-1624(-)|eukprot:CAMPEP_0171496906 /NCGR_PEP_ID=MMETSP0958-20121227/6965_1 /TAXON_ID=87120 /ORGANISM="Aurantiochytrium limacinum, Strain ATCCMYA-1381" /LENGTH=244 /DNA_ID=CAMNT_0012031067 /DNA_START=151 /DNA_END=885 /DNA_ORIENTATION=+
MVALVGLAREQHDLALAKNMLAQREAKELKRLEQQSIEVVPVPPRPESGYMAKLWDNIYGEKSKLQQKMMKQQQQQLEEKRTEATKKRARRRSALREDVLERLNDGESANKIFQELRDLLEGAALNDEVVAQVVETAKKEHEDEQHPEEEKHNDQPMSRSNGPLKRIPTNSNNSSIANRRAPNQNIKPARHPMRASKSDVGVTSAAPSATVKRQCVCPHQDSNQSRSLSPKSFWKTIRRRVLLV